MKILLFIFGIVCRLFVLLFIGGFIGATLAAEKGIFSTDWFGLFFGGVWLLAALWIVRREIRSYRLNR